MSDKLRILLVDDDPALVKTLAMFLQYEGHLVEATTDPFEACKMVKNMVFDLVIADYYMSQMDGIELVHRCRELRNPPEAILITGHWDKISEAKDICCLFKAVLPKPLDIDRLMEELDSVKIVGTV